MRKLVALAAIAAGITLGQEAPKEEFTPDEKVKISQLMLKLTLEQQTVNEARQIFETSAKKFADLRGEYAAATEELRKKYDKPTGCQVNIELTWQCPPEAPKEESE